MDLETDLPRHLTYELESHVALELGHVQAVIGSDGHEELQGDQGGDLALYVGRGRHFFVHHRVEDGHQAVEWEGLQRERDKDQIIGLIPLILAHFG